MFSFIYQKIELQNKKPPLTSWWLLLLMALVFAPHLYLSYQLMVNNQTHDLHLRILGSRLMEAGKNPYTYYWQTGDSIFWYDPNQSIYSSVNGVTTTPFFLWLQKPLLRLNYCQIRIVWWCIEELLLLGTTLLAVLLPATRIRQWLVLLITGTFFLYSRNWWMHVYNGQMYVLYALVFMLGNYVLIKKQQSIVWWLYPIVCLIRPFFLLPLLPFVRFKWKTILTFGIGGLFALVIFLICGHQKNWVQYKEALKVYATENTGGYDTVLRNNEARMGNFPAEDCLKKEKKPDFLHAGCLYTVQSYLMKVGIKCNNTNAFSLALFIVIALILFTVYQFKLAVEPEQQIVLAMLLYFLGELFAPAARNPYNMVQWLPVAVMLLRSANKFIIGLLIIGLCLNHSLPFNFSYEKELGELLMFTAAWLFVLLPKCSISKWQSSRPLQSSPI